MLLPADSALRELKLPKLYEAITAAEKSQRQFFLRRDERPFAGDRKLLKSEHL